MTADQEIALLKDAVFAIAGALACVKVEPAGYEQYLDRASKLGTILKQFRDDEAELKGVSREA